MTDPPLWEAMASDPGKSRPSELTPAFSPPRRLVQVWSSSADLLLAMRIYVDLSFPGL